MKMTLILLPVAIGLVAAVLTVVVGGLFMPRTHTATASARLEGAPTDVWAVITDFDGQAGWRPGLTGVERLPDRNGHRVHKELGGDGLTLEVEVLEPPRRLVTRIADDSLPFGGTWRFDLVPDGGGTLLTITEEGIIKPPAFRYIARIIGHDATMKKYLTALGAHLGESTPRS